MQIYKDGELLFELEHCTILHRSDDLLIALVLFLGYLDAGNSIAELPDYKNETLRQLDSSLVYDKNYSVNIAREWEEPRFKKISSVVTAPIMEHSLSVRNRNTDYQIQCYNYLHIDLVD